MDSDYPFDYKRMLTADLGAPCRRVGNAMTLVAMFEALAESSTYRQARPENHNRFDSDTGLFNP